jgi:hypothetical protein
MESKDTQIKREEEQDCLLAEERKKGTRGILTDVLLNALF